MLSSSGSLLTILRHAGKYSHNGTASQSKQFSAFTLRESQNPWRWKQSAHSKRRLSLTSWHSVIRNVGYHWPGDSAIRNVGYQIYCNSAIRNVGFLRPRDTAPFETSVIQDLVTQHNSKRRLSKTTWQPSETSVIQDHVSQRHSKRQFTKTTWRSVIRNVGYPRPRDSAIRNVGYHWLRDSAIRNVGNQRPSDKRHSKRRLSNTTWHSAITKVGYPRPRAQRRSKRRYHWPLDTATPRNMTSYCAWHPVVWLQVGALLTQWIKRPEVHRLFTSQAT